MKSALNEPYRWLRHLTLIYKFHSSIKEKHEVSQVNSETKENFSTQKIDQQITISARDAGV